jgi:hypothetical protein
MFWCHHSISCHHNIRTWENTDGIQQITEIVLHSDLRSKLNENIWWYHPQTLKWAQLPYHILVVKWPLKVQWESLIVPIPSLSSTDETYIDPLLYIVNLEGHSEIMISLNMHTSNFFLCKDGACNSNWRMDTSHCHLLLLSSGPVFLCYQWSIFLHNTHSHKLHHIIYLYVDNVFSHHIVK